MPAPDSAYELPPIGWLSASLLDCERCGSAIYCPGPESGESAYYEEETILLPDGSQRIEWSVIDQRPGGCLDCGAHGYWVVDSEGAYYEQE